MHARLTEVHEPENPDSGPPRYEMILGHDGADQVKPMDIKRARRHLGRMASRAGGPVLAEDALRLREARAVLADAQGL